MNDFTKEELEELWFFTELHKNKYRLKYPQELLKKLQSMIDNYCDHSISGGEVEIFVDTCHKCDVYILRETHHDEQ